MATVDFSKVLKDVVTIADEVDAQLKEQIVIFAELQLLSQLSSQHHADCLTVSRFSEDNFFSANLNGLPPGQPPAN